MSITLPIYEETGDTLHSHGEHEFRINPARRDVVQVAVDGKFVGMRVERIEHRVAQILNIPLERRVFNTIVVVRRLTTDEAKMQSDDEKIFVDASEKSQIVFSDGSQPLPTPTLQEAVIAYHKLEAPKKKIAVIETASGLKFNSGQIERLHYK